MRRKVSDQLKEWKSRKDRRSLLLRGARQVGKTYSLVEFASREYRHHILLDFVKDPKLKDIFQSGLDVDSIILRISARYPDEDIVPYETALIFDEVQECPAAYASLKSFSDDPRYDVLASGSLLGLKLNDLPDVPVGHLKRIDMHPMDFEEFLWAIGLKDAVIGEIRSCIKDRRPLGGGLHDTIREYMDWYMLVGGMPSAVEAFVQDRSFSRVRSIQRDIVEDYKEDIAKHCAESDRLKTERCFDSLSMQLAKDNRRFMVSKVEPELGYRPSSERYEYALNWLCKAGIALESRKVTDIRLPPEEPGSKRIGEWDAGDGDVPGEQLFKLYVVDTGLLACQYDPAIYSEIVSGNIEVNKGALTENLVACQLACQDRKLLYYEKVREMEIDFILDIGGRPAAIEVKSGRKRSCSSLNKAMEHFGAKGIMLDTLDIFEDDKGVQHYPIYAASFLDCIDARVMPTADFGSVERLNGGERSGDPV